MLVEHLHDDDFVVVLELIGVRPRSAHVAWRLLGLHDDVDHERDDGRHVDVDEDDLHLHRFRAPKTCVLNVAALIFIACHCIGFHLIRLSVRNFKQLLIFSKLLLI